MRRLEGEAGAVDTPIGRLPLTSELDLEGVDVSPEAVQELFAIDNESWRAEADLTEEYFAQFGDRVPQALRGELAELRERLN